MDEKGSKIGRLAVRLGILSQLYTNRMNLLLKEHGFTLSQFSLLNHLVSSANEGHTISDLTEAMEINQPGVTKIVHKLLKEELIDVRTDREDSRKRLVSIANKGREQIRAVNLSLYPDLSEWFQDWQPKEMDEFIAQLEKLSKWLDTNRLGQS